MSDTFHEWVGDNVYWIIPSILFSTFIILILVSSHVQYGVYVKITGNPHDLSWMEYESVRNDGSIFLIDVQKAIPKEVEK